MMRVLGTQLSLMSYYLVRPSAQVIFRHSLPLFAVTSIIIFINRTKNATSRHKSGMGESTALLTPGNADLCYCLTTHALVTTERVACAAMNMSRFI